MTQNRSLDYQAEHSTRLLNRKQIGVIPPGVYQGFHIAANGLIDPGVLMTADGVRIEETASQLPLWGTGFANQGLPPGDSEHPRWDLIVCHYKWEASIPAPVASYRVIQGTPAASPVPPDTVPEDCLLLAMGRMEPGESAYSNVYQMGAPEHLINCTRTRSLSGWKPFYTITHGDRATVCKRYDGVSKQEEIWVIAADTYSDGEEVAFSGTPTFSVPLSASQVKVTDGYGHFSAGDVEAVLHELAGYGRSSETVFGNAAAISTLSDNTDLAIDNLAGSGRTTETVKDNADAIATLSVNTSDAIAGVASDLAGHESDTSSAHDAVAIDLADTTGHLDATQLEAAVKEIMDGFYRAHYREKDSQQGQHKIPLEQKTATSGYDLIWKIAPHFASGGIFLRFYYMNGVLLITLNAEWDGSVWSKDETGYAAYCLKLDSYTDTGFKVRQMPSTDNTDWSDSSWTDLAGFDPDTGLLLAGGPTILTGTGAPSGSPVSGSIYIRTTDGTIYVRQSSAWEQLQIVTVV